MGQTLDEKLAGTIAGGVLGTIGTFLGAVGAGQYGLMQKTGGISSPYAIDMDAAMDFVFGPGKYVVGAGLMVGLLVDGYRGIQRYRKDRARLSELGM